jgi:hypothetical protein
MTLVLFMLSGWLSIQRLPCLPAHTQALLLVTAMSSLHDHVADMAPAVFFQLDKLPTKPDLGATSPFVYPGTSFGEMCAAWPILC